MEEEATVCFKLTANTIIPGYRRHILPSILGVFIETLLLCAIEAGPQMGIGGKEQNADLFFQLVCRFCYWTWHLLNI